MKENYKAWAIKGPKKGIRAAHLYQTKKKAQGMLTNDWTRDVFEKDSRVVRVEVREL